MTTASRQADGAPQCDAGLAVEVLRHWGLEGEWTPLPSYADLNRRLRCAQGQFVVKLSDPSVGADLLDLENQAMRHLERNRCRARTPRLQPTLDGSDMVRLRQDRGRDAHLRVVEFIEGSLLSEGAIDIALATSIGEQVAWLGRGLSDFQHPAADAHKDWRLDALPVLAEAVSLLADAGLRNLVHAGVEDFARRLAQWRTSLPRQVIHNDANDHNIIVDSQSSAVRAIIDFGDMGHGFRLADLAIACIHAVQGDASPQPVMDAVAAGYGSVQPLTDAEQAALPYFIRGRLCQSILMAERAHRADPDNAYILVSQPAVRDLLRRLA